MDGSSASSTTEEGLDTTSCLLSSDSPRAATTRDLTGIEFTDDIGVSTDECFDPGRRGPDDLEKGRGEIDR
jgi:hypothetical protein